MELTFHDILAVPTTSLHARRPKTPKHPVQADDGSSDDDSIEQPPLFEELLYMCSKREWWGKSGEVSLERATSRMNVVPARIAQLPEPRP